MAGLELPGAASRAYFGADGDRPPSDEELKRRETVRPFIDESRKRWKTADAASNVFREKMRRDQRFAAGGGAQWEPTERQMRADEGRPCLEINRIPQFIRQVSNQARQNRSMILVAPRAGDATADIAAAFQGLVRTIESESDADIAYDTATEHQLRIGLGWVRLRSKWANDTTFESVCSIDRIRNPLAVYWDPSVQDATFADMRYAHVVGVVGKDEYEARWGKTSSYASLTEFVRTNASAADWMPEGKVVVVEYFYVTVESRQLVELDNGVVLWEDGLDEYMAGFGLGYPGQPQPQITRDRAVDTRVVRWCLHNAVDVLEGNRDRTSGRIIPGTRIPLFPVVGDEIDLDGEVDYRGMVRDAVDPQRLYNYWTATVAETIALTPKAPWIAEAQQVADYFDDWKDANRKTLSVLLYNARTVDGQIVPKPERIVAEPPIQAMTVGLHEADQDLKSVMGLFEASLGERGPQQSGKAIGAVQQQGLVANSNYLDNLQRTKRAIGRSLVEWIPAVYDTARVVHLLDPANKKKQAMVHTGPQNAPTPQQIPPGVTDIFDLDAGEYDISISTGPSFQTERQEAEARLLELFKVLPGLAAIGADIVLEHADTPAATALAKRAKAMLPPQVQAADDPDAALPRLMQENQQLKMLSQKAHDAILKMSNALQTKQIDRQTKLEVAMIQAQAQLAATAAKIGNDRDITAFQAEFERLSQMIDHLSTLTVTDAEHQHTLEQQAQQAALEPPPPQPQGAPQPAA
jgi:hypothetical protein